MGQTYEVFGNSQYYEVKPDGIYSKRTGQKLVSHNFSRESYSIICIADDYVAQVYGKSGNQYCDFIDPYEKATAYMNLWVADENGKLVEEQVTLTEIKNSPNSYEIPGCHDEPDRKLRTVERYGNCFCVYLNVYYGGDKESAVDDGTLLFVCQSKDWKLSVIDVDTSTINARAHVTSYGSLQYYHEIFTATEFADVLASAPGKTGALSADELGPTGGKLTAKQNGSEITLSASGFKDNVGVDHYIYFLNGREIESDGGAKCSYLLENDLAGTLNFTVRAYDAAGNASKKDAKATLKVKDMTPPDQVTGLVMRDGADEKEALLSWDVPYDNGGQIASYTVFVDGKKEATSKTNSITLKKLKAGEHTFSVLATDAGKNTGLCSQGYVFTIADITAPTGGKLTAKQNGTEITLSASGFKDNVGVDHYVYFLNGREIESDGGAKCSYLLENDLAGTLNFTVRAYDAAGNASKKDAKATVKVKDMTPPDQVTGLTGSRNADGKSVSLRWDVPYDNGGKIASYEIWVDGKKKTTAKTNQATIKGLSQDVHTFEVRALDAAKNSGDFSSALSVNLGRACVLTGLDATNIRNKHIYDDVWGDQAHSENWSAETGGINDLEVKENHYVYIDKITFTDDDASLTLKKRTANSKHETLLDVKYLHFGNGNDLLEIQGDSDCEASEVSFGEGNNTLKLTGGATLSECGDFDFHTVSFGSGNDKIIATANCDMDGGLIDFGAGNDSFLLGKGADADFDGYDGKSGIVFGSGDDQLQIQKGAIVELRDAEIDFGSGKDTMILDGRLCLGSGAVISGMEKVSGEGTLIVSQELLTGDFDLTPFEKGGIDIVNTGESAEKHFTSRSEELSDNQKDKAVSLIDWLEGHSKGNTYLCGEDWASSHLYGAEDEEDWFKLTIKNGEVNGYVGMDVYSDVRFDFYAAKQNKALASNSTVDFSDYDDGVYYIRLRVDSYSAPTCANICMHEYL